MSEITEQIPLLTIPCAGCHTPDDTTCHCVACANCRTVVMFRCAVCDECSDCCRCFRCTRCEEIPSSALCVECGKCTDCCECFYCQPCRTSVPVDESCSFCGTCTDCCQCRVCERCDNPSDVNEFCSHCEDCNDCCQCWDCDSCGVTHTPESLQCSDCGHCEDCCDCNAIIHAYEANPLDYLSFKGKPEGGLFLGVELEVELEGSRHLYKSAERWNDELHDFAILKTDGSLHHGFEIVTAPADLPSHAAFWNRVLTNNRLTDGLSSWDTETCGMHVHVSRTFFTPLMVGKLLVFMNSPATQKPLERLAGRHDTYYARAEPKKIKDAGKVYCAVGGKKFFRQNKQLARYSVLNLLPNSTLEFRLFRGTLKLNHVLANIQFCDAVSRWVRTASIQDCENWNVFWEYVKTEPKRYVNLIQQMA